MSVVVREHREMSLTCKLTREEVREKARVMAEGLKELAGLEEEKKLVSTSLGKRIERKSGEIRRLGEEVRTETEERPVGVADEFHFDAGEVRTVRLDTYEVISRRKMKDSERQDLLPLAERDSLESIKADIAALTPEEREILRVRLAQEMAAREGKDGLQ